MSTSGPAARRVADTDLSRAVSHALRHEPWLYEIELDAHGWAPVSQLLEALHTRGGRWRDVDRAALTTMIETATKQRHELVGDRIRARYGHSVPGRIENLLAEPPEILFHGTAPEIWEVVQQEGLRPMRRQYVHLSVDTETALAVGKRKSRTPLLLQIAAGEASAAGIEFHAGNDRIWLCSHVPAAFIRPARL